MPISMAAENDLSSLSLCSEEGGLRGPLNSSFEDTLDQEDLSLDAEESSAEEGINILWFDLRDSIDWLE